ncbi:hypothetical protein D3C85_159130 [compost metagenome]
MDYADMANSLRREQSKAKEEMVDLTTPPPKGFYDGCTKWDSEFDAECLEMDRNSTVRYLSGEEGKKYMEMRCGKHKGIRPFIQDHVDIVRTMLGRPVVS